MNNDDLEIMAAKSRLIRDLLEETLSSDMDSMKRTYIESSITLALEIQNAIPVTYTDYLYRKVENDAKQRLGFY